MDHNRNKYASINSIMVKKKNVFYERMNDEFYYY